MKQLIFYAVTRGGALHGFVKYTNMEVARKHIENYLGKDNIIQLQMSEVPDGAMIHLVIVEPT